MSRRIHTFTANLLWETTFFLESWEPGRTARATHATVQVGGKGINVSKMLNRLGAENEAICFPGGAVGDQCLAWLKELGFAVQPFAASHETRTGLTVRSPSVPETCFLGIDQPLDEDAVKACCQYLSSLPDGDILTICGSIPGWDQAIFDPLREALDSVFDRLVVAVDTYGPPLAWLTQKPVALIKVNGREFSQLTNAGVPADVAALEGAGLPPRAWIVTNGPHKIKGLDTNGYWEKTPPAVEVISPVGSGDVFLAVLLHSHFNLGLSLAEAADEAIPHAVANSASPGIANYSDELAEALRQAYRRGGKA